MQINSKIYFDNAATTALAPEVLETMTQVLKDNFGNPSSQHSFGRASKSILETTRKKIAEYLGVSASEIIFTSGGTEADNTALIGAVESLGVKHIISSKIEHHAVLHTLEYLQQKKGVRVSYIALDNKGYVDYQNLEELLKNSTEKTLVSLMHANNEIGTLLDLEKVGNLCEKYNALFHSDTVQTLGHYRVEPKKYKLHFLVASAHKFHGPKGVGFLYVDNKIKIDSFIHGGYFTQQQ
jgi:cysteine desulfurase